MTNNEPIYVNFRGETSNWIFTGEYLRKILPRKKALEVQDIQGRVYQIPLTDVYGVWIHRKEQHGYKRFSKIIGEKKRGRT